MSVVIFSQFSLKTGCSVDVVISSVITCCSSESRISIRMKQITFPNERVNVFC